MKNIFILTICSVLVFASCGGNDELIIEDPPEAEVNSELVEFEEGDTKPLAKIDPGDPIRIMVRADAYPGMWADDEGNVFGFYVELEKMVMDRMGQNYVFIPYNDVGATAQALKSGTSHVALAVPDAPDYRALVHLSIPYENINYITFVKAGTKDIGGDNKSDVIKSFYGKKVGVQVRGHIWQLLRDYKEIDLIEFPTTTKALEALSQGMVDAVPEIREIADYYADLNDWNIEAVGIVILVYQNTSGYSRIYDPEIVDRHNEALNSLINDGSLHALHIKYYGDAADDYSLK